ncbi:Uncharacterised protein [uncultured archaeon]|nr:Uncharacterised protein [uncultured archaeon]
MIIICIGGLNTAPSGPKITLSSISSSLPDKFAINNGFILSRESIEIDVTGAPFTEALVPFGIIIVIFLSGADNSRVVLTIKVEMLMKFPIVVSVIVLLTVTIRVSDASNTPSRSFAYAIMV